MDPEIALPGATEEVAEASGQQDDAATAQDQSTDTQEEGDGEKKPEKTALELRLEALERENKRMQRGIDRRTRQLAEARANANLTQRQEQAHNHDTESDSQPLSLTRAELAQMVKAEAEKLAPTLQSQRAEAERRQGVIQSLEQKFGEKFDDVSNRLNEAFGGDERVNGLVGPNGALKPAIAAVFESDQVHELVEWMADEDNADEVEKLSRLGPIQAGKAIARLEDKLKAEPKKAAPKASKAPAPLEPIRGQGSTSGAPDPSDTKAWIRWRNEQERKGL